MTYGRINNNNLALSHKFTNKEKHSKSFKVLYYYPNTWIATNWFNNTKKKMKFLMKKKLNLESKLTNNLEK